MNFEDCIERLRKYYRSSNAEIEKNLGLSNGYISKIDKNPGKLLLALHEKGISTDWFLTGKGSMFLAKDNSIETPEIIEIENQNGIVNMNRNGVIKMSNISMGTMVPSGEKSAPLPVVSPEEEPQPTHPVRAMTVFEIPLLTREQVLRLDPGKEIPCPNAYSGEYPDYTLVSIPLRLREYGTDLRAIVVFNGLMSPLLNPGDVAVFQVTSWNGDGVYVYRMKGDLYISHIKSSGATYRLTKEFRAEEEIPWEGGSFEAIGRVRAVVREIP
jgi:phage repressor protein C with HTH and peptisase S24 domain